MTFAVGEIVEWLSRAPGSNRLRRGVVKYSLPGERVLVYDSKMRYAEVVSSNRLRRPRSVATLCGPGLLA